MNRWDNKIKLVNLSLEETQKLIPDNTILLTWRGSIAHGTYVPQEDPESIDDKDVLGMCLAPRDVYLGLQKFEQKEAKYKEYDSVVYEIRKAFRLLLKQNREKVQENQKNCVTYNGQFFHNKQEEHHF